MYVNSTPCLFFVCIYIGQCTTILPTSGSSGFGNFKFWSGPTNSHVFGTDPNIFFGPHGGHWQSTVIVQFWSDEIEQYAGFTLVVTFLWFNEIIATRLLRFSCFMHTYDLKLHMLSIFVKILFAHIYIYEFG